MSVYVLPYNSNEQLSAHINARELRCKCGGTHNITVNTELIDKTEKLIDTIAEAKKTTPDKVHIISVLQTAVKSMISPLGVQAGECTL